MQVDDQSDIVTHTNLEKLLLFCPAAHAQYQVRACCSADPQPAWQAEASLKGPPKAILHSITSVYVYALHYRFTAWHKHFHSLAAQMNNTLQYVEHDADTHATPPGWCVTVDQPREDSSPCHALQLQSSEEFLSRPLGPRCYAALASKEGCTLYSRQACHLPLRPCADQQPCSYTTS